MGIKTEWFVYIVLCKDNTLYTGISNNIIKRVHKHNIGKGARYTRTRRPVKLVYTEGPFTKSGACKKEILYKSYSKKKKLSLITS